MMQALRVRFPKVAVFLLGLLALLASGCEAPVASGSSMPVPMPPAEPEQVGTVMPAVETPAASTAVASVEAAAVATSDDEEAEPAVETPTADNPYPVLVKSREFRAEGRERALRVDFADLDLEKIIGMKELVPEAPAFLPDWLKALEGKQIRIRGFMLPTFELENLPYFVLTRDTGACCFGPNPTIYYLAEVKMKKGHTVNYIENKPFDVIGTFRVDVTQLEETGKVYQFYHLDDAVVIER